MLESVKKVNGLCKLVAAALVVAFVHEVSANQIMVGVAAVDITPDYPIRLSGYGNRRAPSEGVAQKIWAKALAFSDDDQSPAILITVDNCGVPITVTREVSRRLASKGIPSERLAVCSSHTHTGPCLTGVLPLLFGSPIIPEEQQVIDRYTQELTDKLEQVAVQALADRKAAKLTWTQGTVGFANNRRTPGGPVDHSLPVMFVWSPDDKLRAVLVNYACHCTTLGGDFNQICGDWAGYAQEAIQRDHPGAVALVAIGCGADANPNLRTGLTLAVRHGETVAQEVKRLLGQPQRPITAAPGCKLEQIELLFEDPAGREHWAKLTQSQHPYAAYHAKVQLDRLEKGKELQKKLDYPVQTWCFGDDLAMVMLAGEVVVDYALRLKSMYDPDRLWVNAYSNDVPCYIPSKRVLKEGGYEAESSMIYYDRPGRLRPEVEDAIIHAVQRQLPASFYSKELQSRFPPAKSPEQSLASITVPKGLRVELVAAEPLVIDPVAIDFGADGRLWVAEMHDYPAGIHGDFQPGGRVRFLTDTDGDGKYDSSTLFLDEVPFPTGLMEWRNGLLICAAPDILYAEDTNGDGKADVREVLYTGFYTDNYQARVNGLVYGLDNWVYGACGLFGGNVRSSKTNATVNISSRDFRFLPDSGVLEPETGRTQQGRIRNDWGDWFGNTNSNLLFHYPLVERYLVRNPHFAAPAPQIHVPTGTDPNRLFPSSVTLERFNNPDSENRVTSACGPGIYRDIVLGQEYYENAFICEPVHNLVTRRILEPQGLTFQGVRAEGEQTSEFFASTDNWCRPAQVLTGPDGGLWVVDMYRFVIEHPRFITQERLAELDVRAGEDRGRIYRILPENEHARPAVPEDLTSISDEELAARIDTSNGPIRDLVQRLLVHRQATNAAITLRKVANTSSLPAARLQALCTLQGIGCLDLELLQHALKDSHPQVRRHAIRLAESIAAPNSELQKAVFQLVDDPQPVVRHQLALSLGEWEGEHSGAALGKLATGDVSDPYLRAAILSSSVKHLPEVAKAVTAHTGANPHLLAGLLETAASVENPKALVTVLQHLESSAMPTLQKYQLLAKLIDVLGRRKLTMEDFTSRSDERVAAALRKLRPLFESAHQTAANVEAPLGERLAAIPLLGRGFDHPKEAAQVLGELLVPTEDPQIQAAAIETLGKLNIEEVPNILLAHWKTYTPSLRGKVLGILFLRTDWTLAMLQAVERGEIPPSGFGATERQQLTENKSPQVRDLANRVLQLATSARADVLAEYESVSSMKGDPVRGRKLFEKHCTVCHQLDGKGFAVGPDLRMLTDRSPQALLVAILDPNRAVETKFVGYNALLVDGRLLTGLLAHETGNSITLVAQEGKQEVVLRQDLQVLQSSGKSYMPEGLEKDLQQQDLADVIAYLNGLESVSK